MKDGIYMLKDGSLTRMEAGKRVRYAKGDRVELTGEAAKRFGASLLAYIGPARADVAATQDAKDQDFEGSNAPAETAPAPAAGVQTAGEQLKPAATSPKSAAPKPKS